MCAFKDPFFLQRYPHELHTVGKNVSSFIFARLHQSFSVLVVHFSFGSWCTLARSKHSFLICNQSMSCKKASFYTHSVCVPSNVKSTHAPTCFLLFTNDDGNSVRCASLSKVPAEVEGHQRAERKVYVVRSSTLPIKRKFLQTEIHYQPVDCKWNVCRVFQS